MPLIKVKCLYVRFPYNPHYVMCFVEVCHVSVFVQQCVHCIVSMSKIKTIQQSQLFKSKHVYFG